MNANMSGKREKVVWGGRVRLAVMLAAAMLCATLLTSCSETVRSGQASSYLVLTSLTTSANSSTLSSDVRNDTTGGIAEDSGRASFQLNMKDVLNTPSANNAITLTQYHVEYIRSDGHNVQGVDVPYAFDGGVTLTVTGTGSVGFTLVRVQAKQEAPLQALAFSGGANTITTIAKITFYGHDQTGREVSVTGNIQVTFSDWAG
jgi:hypothetical protein